MTTMIIDDGSRELQEQCRPSVTKLSPERRTREQCQLAMLRFHPACNLHAVLSLLLAHGYVTEQTRDGVTWIAPLRPGGGVMERCGCEYGQPCTRVTLCRLHQAVAEANAGKEPELGILVDLITALREFVVTERRRLVKSYSIRALGHPAQGQVLDEDGAVAIAHTDDLIAAADSVLAELARRLQPNEQDFETPHGDGCCQE